MSSPQQVSGFFLRRPVLHENNPQPMILLHWFPFPGLSCCSSRCEIVFPFISYCLPFQWCIEDKEQGARTLLSENWKTLRGIFNFKPNKILQILIFFKNKNINSNRSLGAVQVWRQRILGLFGPLPPPQPHPPLSAKISNWGPTSFNFFLGIIITN